MEVFHSNMTATQDTGERGPEEEEPVVLTVTNVRLVDLPISYQEIKDGVFDLAQQIQQD